MLGNPKWFRRRKYTGWGYSPQTWQGWFYVAGWVASLIILMKVTQWIGLALQYQVLLAIILIALMLADALNIARKMPKDERESIHEAYSERNASWMMIGILLIGLIYQLIPGLINNGSLIIDPFILAALLGGTIAKALTNWYLLDK